MNETVHIELLMRLAYRTVNETVHKELLYVLNESVVIILLKTVDSLDYSMGLW